MEGVLVKEFSFELCTDWDQMAMQIADIYPIGPSNHLSLPVPVDDTRSKFQPKTHRLQNTKPT